MFGVASCLDAANRGGVDGWVDRYLSGGPDANAGLRDGLRRKRRYWLGPLFVPAVWLERCCGPESSMEFRVSAEKWTEKVSSIAASLRNPQELPPLIVEWRSGTFIIRDGNHRFAAMVQAGWTHCSIILWCNDPAAYEEARAAAVRPDTLPPASLLAPLMRRDGWLRFPGAIGAPLIQAALEAIRADLAANFDPARQKEYDNRSFCPDICGSAAINDLLIQSPAKKILDELVGWDRIAHDRGQIAIRRAHNTDRPYPPEWHIDGIPTGVNGLLPGTDISNFTALIGVYLTPIETEFAGNFTVWPGSHELLQSYFRERGPIAMREGAPKIDPGEPVQLLAMPGDLVICHYQLAHTAAVNLSEHDRIAIYFRSWFRDIDERRWHLLANIWDGWRL